MRLEESLRAALGRVQDRWGAQALERATARMQRRSAVDLPDVLPTGLKQLDELTSIGGLPLGRVTLLLGANGSGRMMVAYHLLASASRSTAAALLLDMLGHADPWLMATLGADLSRVLVLRDMGLRDALEAALALVRAGAGCVVADLPARAGVSRLWDPYAAALAGACAKESVPLLISAETVAEPLAYASSLTLRLQHRDWVWRHGDVIGTRISATVEKSKLGMPGSSVEFSLAYPLGTFIPPADDVDAASTEDAVQGPIQEPLLKVLSA
jgi:hypothetical protein